MKKWLKITLGVIGGIILLFIVDLVCIFTIHRPLFAIKKDNGSVYKGIFYDTYNCAEYSSPQIKAKGTKFACADSSRTHVGKIKEIVDTTKDIEGFSCDQALEKIYEDNDYTYSLECIKSSYIVVNYEDGTKENIISALNSKKVNMKDLDRFGIKYIKEENKDIHSFFGKVIESHQDYMIVEQIKDTNESKTGGQFHVDLGKKNDALYEIGTIVKITYVGGINESDPAKIGVTKIEVKSADKFELVFYQESGNVKRLIVDKNKNKDYDYNIYLIGGKADIIIDNETYSLEEALNNKKITMNEIISKANNDYPNTPTYDDGGSAEYHYSDYTIIKMHTIDGNRDVYIGNKKLTINDVK